MDCESLLQEIASNTNNLIQIMTQVLEELQKINSILEG
jgi:hypothetical protein